MGKGDVQTEFGRGFGRRVAIIVLIIIVLVGEAWRASGLSADGTALLEFKNAITSDPQDALRTWNGADATPCSWTGINCKTIPGFQEDRVVDIVLPRYALEGTLSPSLGDLAYLETVNLDSNQLSGGLPRELFNAANISSLSLSNNKLSGDIPTEIRYLGQQLRVLEVNGNSFTSLPESIVYCSHLQRLLLNDNNITGLLPVGVGSNWTQLERLDLSVNRFSGPVPGDFGNLTALQGNWSHRL